MILQEVTDTLSTKLKSQLTIEEIVIGAGFTGVALSNEDAGISMNLRRGEPFGDNHKKTLLEKQIGRKALDAVKELAGFTDTVFTSIRVALLNALSSPFLNDEHLAPYGLKIIEDDNSSISTSVNEGDVVTLVGFGGLVRPVLKRALKVYVSELDTDFCTSHIVNTEGTATGPTRFDVVHASQAKEAFEISDKIYITGSALVTQTMEKVLADCPSRAKAIIYGHSAALFPAPLFKRGAHLLRTRKVTDAKMMMDLIKNYGRMVERFFPQASQDLSIVKGN